jgi:hypothetical protein
MFLIIGFVRRGGLASRNDPFDPHALAQEQIREKLRVCTMGKVIEEIDHEPHPRSKWAVEPVASVARMSDTRVIDNRRLQPLDITPSRIGRWFILEGILEELGEKPPV